MTADDELPVFYHRAFKNRPLELCQNSVSVTEELVIVSVVRKSI